MAITQAKIALKFLREEKRFRLEEIRDMCALDGVEVSVPTLCQVSLGNRGCNEKVERALIRLQKKHSKRAYARAMP